MMDDSSKELTNEEEIKNIEIDNIPFMHLAPQDDRIDSVFENAMNYAINCKDIKNVAITGIYGAGKSSYLKSYFLKGVETENLSQINCVNISLGTFATEKSKINTNAEISEKSKESIDDKNKVSSLNENETPILSALSKSSIDIDTKYSFPDDFDRQIEKSILQQLFFSVDSKKLPFSRIKRIQKKSILTSVLLSLAIVFLFLFYSNFTYISVDEESTKTLFSCLIDLFKNGNIWIKLLSVFSFASIVSILSFIFKGISNISINKLSIKNIEFDISKETNDSLLNKYLDEILYFFETTGTNIVIFEDIDRFQNTDIFPKLRELNILINNYEVIKKTGKVLFIYAVKDKLFENTTRTKFFDFIIPIIPVVHSQNAGAKLIEERDRIHSQNPTLFPNLEKELSNTFLESIGLYVTDMRLLLNCMNEFLVYFGYLINSNTFDINSKEKLNKKKLFSIILYKNLFPNDFEALYKDTGILYSALSSRKELIENQIKIIDEKLKKLDAEEKVFENTRILRKDEIDKLYIYAFLKSINYQINVAQINSSTFVNEMKTGSVRIAYAGYSTRDYTVNFKSIENQVNPKHSYDEIINDLYSGKETFAEQRRALLAKKEEIYSKTLKDVYIKKENDEMNFQMTIINFFITNGYIDEDYYCYITYFYAGAITKMDRTYLMNVKQGGNPNYSLELRNFENLINKMTDEDWCRPAILNNPLLNYLLQHNHTKLNTFIDTMLFYDCSNPFIEDQRFILQINSNLEYKEKFVNAINQATKKYSNWVDALFCKNDEFLITYILYTDNFDTKVLDFIIQNPRFLCRNLEDNELKEIACKFKKYNCKFTISNDLLQFNTSKMLEENCLFNIDEETLLSIIQMEKGEKAVEGLENFWGTLRNIENDTVLSYLNDNLERILILEFSFFHDVLNEPSNVLEELLNNENIRLSVILDIVDNNREKISSFESIKNRTVEIDETSSTLWNYLIIANRVQANWNNVMIFYKSMNKIHIPFAEYLNNEENCEQLCSIPINENIFNEDDYELLFKEMLQSSEINATVMEKYITIFHFDIDDISTLSIQEKFLPQLVKYDKLKYSIKNLSELRERNIELVPEFIKKGLSELFTDQDEIAFTLKDISSSLKKYAQEKDFCKKLMYSSLSCLKEELDYEDVIIFTDVIISHKFSEKIRNIDLVSVCRKIIEIQPERIIQFLCLQGKWLSNQEFLDIVMSMNNQYQNLFKPKTYYWSPEVNEVSEEFLILLKEKNVISNYTKNKDSFRISLKRK